MYKERTNILAIKEKIILDTDMGSDCDDVGALALLHEYSRQGRAEIIAVIYSSGAIPYRVGIIDSINRLYRNQVPIGATYDKTIGDIIDKMDAEKLAKDTSGFGYKLILNAALRIIILSCRNQVLNENFLII